MIESLNNAKVKYAGKLKLKKYRSETGEFLVEGLHLVEEAIKSGNCLFIFTTETTPDFVVETDLVTTEVMKKISELGEESGYVAICKKPLKKPLSNRILLLDGIQDPGNMGTLIRTAAAFGFGTVIAENSVDFYNEKVIRASQGTMFHVDLRDGSLKEFIQNHRDYRHYGTDVLAGTDARTIDFKDELATLILGNEGAGVSPEIGSLADVNLKIPMHLTESLNVGIAGGILMYEIQRRK